MTDAEWTELEARYLAVRERWRVADTARERAWNEFSPVLEAYNHERHRRELIAELKKEGAI